jgi:hypothetical protein
VTPRVASKNKSIPGRLARGAGAGRSRPIGLVHQTMGDNTMRITSVLSFATVFLCACSVEPPKPMETPLIGKWVYVGAKSCADTHTFRSDGTFSSTSGTEALEGSYSVEGPPNVNAPFKVVRTINSGNGRPDCGGKVSTGVGKADTRYVAFSPQLNEMIVCSSPTTAQCLGPFKRTIP